MADQRGGGIAWTDETWNPVRGCSRVSPGCEHCYAEVMAARFSGPGQPYEGLARRRSNGAAQWTGEVRLVPERLTDPLRWRRPRRVFVNSMSDLFHEGLSDEAIDQVFAVMALAPQHTFQVLTKRPERMLDWFQSDPYSRILRHADQLRSELPGRALPQRVGVSDPNVIPYRHVWLGVSVEDQARADERIPLLLQTPAAVRFISAEPLLGPVKLTHYFGGTGGNTEECGGLRVPSGRDGGIGDRHGRANLAGGGQTCGQVAGKDAHDSMCEASGREGSGLPERPSDDREPASNRPRASNGVAALQRADSSRPDGEPPQRSEAGQPTGEPGTGDSRRADGTRGLGSRKGPTTKPPSISWVIVGGESGPGARPCDVAWVRSIVAECQGAQVPAFTKQLGARPFDGRFKMFLSDRAGADPSEWPEDLRVQEFPASTNPTTR